MTVIKKWIPLGLAFALSAMTACATKQSLPYDALRNLDKDSRAAQVTIAGEKSKVHINENAIQKAQDLITLYGTVKQNGEENAFYLELGFKDKKRQPDQDRLIIRRPKEVGEGYEYASYQIIQGNLIRIVSSEKKETNKKPTREYRRPNEGSFLDLDLGMNYDHVTVITPRGTIHHLSCTQDPRVDKDKQCTDFPEAEDPSVVRAAFDTMRKTIITPVSDVIASSTKEFLPIPEETYKNLMRDRINYNFNQYIK